MATLVRDPGPLLFAVLAYVSTLPAFLASNFPPVGAYVAALSASLLTAIVTQRVLSWFNDKWGRVEHRAAVAVEQGALPALKELEGADLYSSLATVLHIDFGSEYPSVWKAEPPLPEAHAWRLLLKYDKRARSASCAYERERVKFSNAHTATRNAIAQLIQERAPKDGLKELRVDLLTSLILSAAATRHAKPGFEPEMPHTRTTKGIPTAELEWGSSRPAEGQTAPISALEKTLKELVAADSTRKLLDSLARAKASADAARLALIYELLQVRSDGKPRNLPLWPREENLTASE